MGYTAEQVNAHIAHHEAGHLVAYVHLMKGACTFEVTLTADEDALARHIAAAVAYPDEGAVRSAVLVLYAGAAAELRLDPSQTEAVRAGAEQDDQNASRWLRLVAGDAEEQRRRERELRESAAAVVAEHWAEVEAVAGALVARKKLDSVEARLIAAAAAGDGEAAVRLVSYRRTRALL